ncbi:MAG: chitobiase/beta-hexosaminidase C-terminal domain-containing protein [Verrucomicrobia bacterium]|nr:chitobiase/beta-hexosaminidase C-terminal domain-containing protein [Verrucomicrobiota bacterium]
MKFAAIQKRLRSRAVAGLAVLLAVASARAASVVSVGGGPLEGYPSAAGYIDGDTAAVSQFNGPSGLALDSTGNYLFVADRNNNALRKLNLPGNSTSTFAATNHVSKPVDVALDRADNVYVLNAANGTNGFISKFNTFGNFLGRLAAPLTNATAVTIDGNTNLYITELGGTIKRISRSGVVTKVVRFTAPGVQLKGIALTDDCNLIVSDAANHALWHIHLVTGTVSLFSGGNGAGDTFGDPGFAQFNQPEHLARAGNGVFVLADRGNHRVKLVDSLGIATPLYGISSNRWFTYPSPDVYPGWWDGNACEEEGCAEAREPVGVTVSSAGTVFTTEAYYHLIRSAVGADLAAPLPPPVPPLLTGPAGLAINSAGSFVFVADQWNDSVVRLELASNRETNFATVNLSQPIAVAVDAAQNVFVLSQGDGSISRFNQFGNFLSRSNYGLVQPTGMTIDSATNILVCELGGVIKRVSSAGTVTSLASGLPAGVQLRGIAFMDDGMIAVSDSANQAVWLIDPARGTNMVLTGNHGAGAGWGARDFVQFNGPQQLAKAGGDLLVVADQGNHRLMVVDRAGTATNLVTDNSVLFFGRAGDPVEPGDTNFLSVSLPFGVLVAPNGDVFSSETSPTGVGVLRWTSGSGLLGPGVVGGGGGGGGSGITLTAPVMSPNSGYYPLGQAITITSPNSVFYTTDGSDPTTNSFPVPMSGNVGAIVWNDPQHDLTFLRLRAYSGTNMSVVVSGQAAGVNTIGVTRDLVAGVGSTVLVPIVMNLRSNDQVRSLQYRVEVTPQNGAPPVRASFDAISISSNDFVTVVGASVPGTIGYYTAAPYSIPNPANPGEMIPGGLAVSSIGTNANFLVKNFGTVAMLKVPIRGDAPLGATYLITLVNLSATSDGLQTPVTVTPMPTRAIIVSNFSYVVGDSSPGYWYNAGEFGDADLNNNDVNNAFYASLGVHVPHTFSDVFDAMDAFPPDEASYLGGDGEVRYLDWQVILLRSLRLDTNNYLRAWSVGGTRVSNTTPLKSAKTSKGGTMPPPPGQEWLRQAVITSLPFGGASPGGYVSMPVVVDVAPGYSLAGLSFRAILTPENGAPPVSGISFTAALGKPTPMQVAPPAPNEILCGWPLVPAPAFNPPLQGSNVIGHVNFYMPPDALPGHSYALRFRFVDGAPNIATQFNLETIAACASVGAGFVVPQDLVSEQWKTNFFGNVTNLMADAFADADGDGVPNWKEYLAGTNPTNALSRLQFLRSHWTNAPVRGPVLSWLTAPGKLYALERSDRVNGTNWTTFTTGLTGDGNVRSCLDPNASGTWFYRLRLQR